MLTIDDLRTGDGFYYLASPYTHWKHGLGHAYVSIARLAGLVLARGVTVYSPIVHCHTIAIQAGIDPTSHEFWLPHDRPLALAAQGIIVAALEGWRESYGIGEELKWFGEAKKPRFLLDPITLDVQVIP